MFLPSFTGANPDPQTEGDSDGELSGESTSLTGSTDAPSATATNTRGFPWARNNVCAMSSS